MKNLLSILLILAPLCLAAQEENIVDVMDQLRADWDAHAENLHTYDDLKELCRNKDLQHDLTALLDQIHHYDSSLFQIAKKKYWDEFDQEAKAAMDDITELERDFTTKSFSHFMRKECRAYNRNEHRFNHEGEKYESAKERISMALVIYIDTITKQVDMIDDHAHHLDY